MNFKESTIELEINLQGKVISNSSALLFGNEDGEFLLSSKHSFCVNYDQCIEKKCNTCIAPTDLASIKSSSIDLSVIELNQSVTKDVAIARISNNANNAKVKLQKFSKLDNEYQAWKGGTKDRLILNTPAQAGSHVQLNIHSNINSHGEAKNFEVSGFSGSPVFIDRHGEEGLCCVI
ncbi:hypothetical protein AB4189_18975, partial [Vibrio sp. 10N.286.49.E1]